MPRRKLSRRRSTVVSNAVSPSHLIDALEQRLMFTTFSAPAGGLQEFQFEAAGGVVMRLAYSDVTFEAFGVIVNPLNNNATVTNFISPDTMTPPQVGVNLFSIYVSQSFPDSVITVAPIPRVAPGQNYRADQPFGGGHPIHVFPAVNGQAYTIAPGGIGSGVLGATTLPIANVNPGDVPIISVADPGPTGVYPGDYFGDGTLHAGFYVPNDATTGLPQNFQAFKFAGEVFGGVSVSGNIQMVYAGSLLTGDATGISVPIGSTNTRTIPGNFNIGGDIRDLITAGDVGGAIGINGTNSVPNYSTGFDATIGGKVGQVEQLNGGFFGTMEVSHSTTVPGIADDVPEQEVELKNTGNFFNGDPGGIGQIFEGTGQVFLPYVTPPHLPAPFTNDTAATAQYLGTEQAVDVTGIPLFNQNGTQSYDTYVEGTLQNAPPYNGGGDPADWYAVSMLAGVPLTVQLGGPNTGLIITELQDPSGRIIASDIESVGGGAVQVRTDRPGIYRIGLVPVAGASNLDLAYTLTVSGTGDQGLGVLAAGGRVSDMGQDGFLTISNGDFGGIVAAGSLISITTGPTALATPPAPIFASSTIIVSNGSLRTIIADSIGTTTPSGIGEGPFLNVPHGSVGLLQSTNPITGVLEFETQFDPGYLALATPQFVTNTPYATAIGGSIQTIDAATTLVMDAGVDGGIGTIRAGNMATNPASYIDVNADNTGSDGIIDLVDVVGQFGTLAAGGPDFVTHDGGDVRYVQIGGAIFLPLAFGQVLDVATQYTAGETTNFTDDSGNIIAVTADGPTTTTTQQLVTGTITTTATVTTGPQASILSYPVLDKGGKIPLVISSTGSLTIAGAGNAGTTSNVEIGRVSIFGIGRQITPAVKTIGTSTVPATDANGNQLIEQIVPTNAPAGVTTNSFTDTTDEFLSITGPAKIDVLNTVATIDIRFPLNSPVEVYNATRGELVNFTAPGIGTLKVNGNLGFATPVGTPAAVLQRAVVSEGNTYPFVQQHTAVTLGTGFVVPTTGQDLNTTGDAVSIQVGGAVGNVNAGGTIQSLVANAGQSLGVAGAKPILGQFNGIVGPILGARLLYVNVGQGLLPSGAGLVGLAGIYATYKVGIVNNNGNPNGNIRGNIISAENDPSGTGIDSVTLQNASIIGAQIGTIHDSIVPPRIPQFIETSPLSGVPRVVAFNGNNFSPGQPIYVYDVGPVTVSGLGGIIGTQIYAGSLAAISVVNGGFGIFSSDFQGQSAKRIGSVTASGYGIRDTVINAVGFLGPVTLTGNGTLLPTTTFPIDVRPSDTVNALDPFFGTTPDRLIDINKILGTTAVTPNIANVTDTGVLEDSTLSGADFTGLTADKARTATPITSINVLPAPSAPNIPYIGTIFSNSISFGGTVGYLRVVQAIDGLQVTAGALRRTTFSSSVNRLGISVAGTITNLTVHGNLGFLVRDPRTGLNIPDSYVSAGGPSGTIGTLRVLGNMSADVTANGEIQNMLVFGDVTGSITALGQGVHTGLGNLRVFGAIFDGTTHITGNVGSIIVYGGLGSSTGSLAITGNANLIQIGADRKRRGSALKLALSVNGTLKKLAVFGQITGSVNIGGDLTNLSVQGDATTPNIITGNINVGGRLGTASVINGNIASDISAENSISRFVLTRGNVNSGATVESKIDSIRDFRIVGGANYGLNGSLLAPSGIGEHIDISGNIGDGVNPAVITSTSISSLVVRGSILSGASISTRFNLDQLLVDGDINTGAVIVAHPLRKITVKGKNNGTITKV